MNYTCTRQVCQILFNLLDSIEFAESKTGIKLPVPEYFRYNRIYNMRYLGKVLDEMVVQTKLDEPHHTTYQSYMKELQVIQQKYDLGKEKDGGPKDMTQEQIEEMKKEVTVLQEKYAGTIAEANKKIQLTKELLEQEVTIKFKKFRRSSMPDLSINKNNDAFVYHFLNRGLLVDDLPDEDDLMNIVKKPTIPPSVKSSEAFGSIGISQS